jgi:hypothetical protein
MYAIFLSTKMDHAMDCNIMLPWDETKQGQKVLISNQQHALKMCTVVLQLWLVGLYYVMTYCRTAACGDDKI